MLRLPNDGRGSLARDMTLRRPVEGDGEGRMMGNRGDAEEGGHAGGQLEHWLLLDKEGKMKGRQMLTLPG